MNYTYKYARPAVTCDIVVFKGGFYHNTPTKVLLITRGQEPFKGMLAIPGGFMEQDEELNECAARELKEETGVNINPSRFRQVLTIGDKNRDPRGRIISVVYTLHLRKKNIEISAGDDASAVAWYDLFGQVANMELAADHKDIINKAYSYWIKHYNL